ncbi:MAG: hypothetical protein IK062_03435 [Selenomonadaceae bacterium]|nr:hypothetical protein [Selenomonadaceae bacterium]
MNFKLPNNNFNEHQLELLENIQLSQKNILEKCAELNGRISELEKTQQNIFSAISNLPQQKDDKPEESFLDKSNFNIFLSIASTLIICAVLAVFGWHFWDIPSQTQAVNDYIYSQIIKESSSLTFP